MELKINDIINDPMFINKLDGILKSMIDKREIRPMPIHGMKYKRDWYDRIKESNGSINKEYFLKHLIGIWTKSSVLSARDRQIVAYVGNITLQEYLKQK